MLEGKEIKADPFKRMKGSEVGIEWLETDETAMLEPVIIESTEGLGMKMPPKDFTVNDVAELVGEDTPVEVIGTAPSPVCSGYSITLMVARRCRHTVQLTRMDSRQVG